MSSRVRALVARLAPVAVVVALSSAGCKTADPLPVECDPACAVGFVCTEGACVADGSDAGAAVRDMAVPNTCMPACTGALPHCGARNKCVACLVDDHCPAGQICKTLGDGSTVCAAGCKDDARCGGGSKKCCDGQCLDTAADVRNCGGCAMACSGQNASATCAAGKCVNGPCRSGFGDCDGDAANGCEASLRVDPANCMACGAACSFPKAIAACSNECYIAACEFGFDDCNGDPMDGCEKAVLDDALNCGGCGMVCPARANAKTACRNSTCTISSCTLGYADCDMMDANGCEANVGTDAKNCGACGAACAQGEVCRGGGCTCAMCMIPNASARCVNAQCLFDKCNPGYSNCDGNTNNGCEVDSFNDKLNCGDCGVVCPMDMPFCNAGRCDKAPPGKLLGQLGNFTFYAVQVMGAMTDTNCRNTCRAAGLNIPCQAQAGCQYNDNLCTITAEMSCGNPMQSLAMKLCNQNPSGCPALYGVYQYMGGKWSNDSACGAEQGQWCVTGGQQMNKFAMCVR